MINPQKAEFKQTQKKDVAGCINSSWYSVVCKPCLCNLCREAAKRQYREKLDSFYSIADARRMWQGLQHITDYRTTMWRNTYVKSILTSCITMWYGCSTVMDTWRLQSGKDCWKDHQDFIGVSAADYLPPQSSQECEMLDFQAEELFFSTQPFSSPVIFLIIMLFIIIFAVLHYKSLCTYFNLYLLTSL